MQLQLPSPIQELHSPLLRKAKVRLSVKRDDQIHPWLGGNKWRKLKYNLQAAKQQEHTSLLTFGGAYSNHLYATAGAGDLFGFRSIGIIRGEEYLPLNPTLAFCRERGMQLHYMNRSDYREKTSEAIIQQLKEQFGEFYLIPEGGSNALAVQGVAEAVDEISVPEYDYLAVACGSGGTLAGLATGLNRRQQLLGFPVLKGGSFLKNEADALSMAHNGKRYQNVQLFTGYHQGGYAKTTAELLSFIRDFYQQHHILLDPIYTGKLFFGLFDLIGKGHFKAGTHILAFHTGGQQGIAGWEERTGQTLI